jgi:uncharacterized small protein (DUF1192 family)
MFVGTSKLEAIMAAIDEDSLFGAPSKAPKQHEIGQPLDLISAAELAERIESLKQEILRLEAAIGQREATKLAASAFFKS